MPGQPLSHTIHKVISVDLIKLSSPMAHIGRNKRLYEIERSGDRIVVTFKTQRWLYVVPIALVTGMCMVVIIVAFRQDWNGNIISGLIGGSISLTLTACWAMFEHVTRYRVSIDSELIYLQRVLMGVPVGRTFIYSRAAVRDLGVYPIELRGQGTFSLGKLSVWVGGKSIQLEDYFPIQEGARLARDLRELGVEFKKTYLSYDEDRAIITGEYLSY